MNSTYPSSFSKVSKFCNLSFTSQEYTDLWHKHGRLLPTEVAQKEYWPKLNYYTIARCPICSSKYEVALDLHSLWTWSGRGASRWIGDESYQSPKCAHLIGVNTIVNLNGNIPVELDHFDSLITDIPYVKPEFFQDDMKSMVVMHSLAICRIENNTFVPRYSVYTFTYYAGDPIIALDRAWDKLFLPEHLDSSDGYGGASVFSFHSLIYQKDEMKDLLRWVAVKRLYWLDLDQPDLPLKSGPPEEFPYTNIQGFGCEYLYVKRPRPRWWWQLKNWHPDGEIWGRYSGRLLAKPDW